MKTAHDVRFKILAELLGCTDFPKKVKEPLQNLRQLRVHKYLAPPYKNRSLGRSDTPGFMWSWLTVKPNFRSSTPEEAIILIPYYVVGRVAQSV